MHVAVVVLDYFMRIVIKHITMYCNNLLNNDDDALISACVEILRQFPGLCFFFQFMINIAIMFATVSVIKNGSAHIDCKQTMLFNGSDVFL